MEALLHVCDIRTVSSNKQRICCFFPKRALEKKNARLTKNHHSTTVTDEAKEIKASVFNQAGVHLIDLFPSFERHDRLARGGAGMGFGEHALLLIFFSSFAFV